MEQIESLFFESSSIEEGLEKIADYKGCSIQDAQEILMNLQSSIKNSVFTKYLTGCRYYILSRRDRKRLSQIGDEEGVSKSTVQVYVEIVNTFGPSFVRKDIPFSLYKTASMTESPHQTLQDSINARESTTRDTSFRDNCKEAARLREKGKPYTEVASIMGWSPSYVSELAKIGTYPDQVWEMPLRREALLLSVREKDPMAYLERTMDNKKPPITKYDLVVKRKEKELLSALHIAATELAQQKICPNFEQICCVRVSVTECTTCWKKYLLDKGKSSLNRGN